MQVIALNAHNMFEEYLQDIHSKHYSGTDDDMPEAFESWLCDIDIDTLIEYGNNAMAQAGAKALRSIHSEKRSETSRENGKKGGRPKKMIDLVGDSSS